MVFNVANTATRLLEEADVGGVFEPILSEQRVERKSPPIRFYINISIELYTFVLEFRVFVNMNKP